jgi:hypothetical protein
MNVMILSTLGTVDCNIGRSISWTINNGGYEQVKKAKKAAAPAAEGAAPAEAPAAAPAVVRYLDPPPSVCFT